MLQACDINMKLGLPSAMQASPKKNWHADAPVVGVKIRDKHR